MTFLKIDATSYGILIHIYGVRGEIDKMMDLFRKMKENTIQIDIGIYCTLMNVFGKRGQIQQMNELFEELKKTMKPTNVAYNIVVNALGKKKDLKSVLNLHEEMREFGLNPDVITYTSTIQILSKSRAPSKQQIDMVKQMYENGIKPSVWCVVAIVDCFRKIIDDLPKGTSEILNQMESNNNQGKEKELIVLFDHLCKLM